MPQSWLKNTNRGVIFGSIAVVLSVAAIFSDVGVNAEISGLAAGSRIQCGSARGAYFLGTDDKRYLFPNDQTYKSWFSNYNGIKVTSNCANIELGGNVTMKPGITLVQFPYSNKVYAVEAPNVLRWITTAEIARTLYPSTNVRRPDQRWQSAVRTVIEQLYSNYKFGEPITDASQFNPAAEAAKCLTVNECLGLGIIPETPRSVIPELPVNPPTPPVVTPPETPTTPTPPAQPVAPPVVLPPSGQGANYTSGPEAPDGVVAPSGGQALMSFEIINDRAVQRLNEVAYSSLPFPRTGANAIYSTDGLAVIGPGEKRIPAQFEVISRWGSTVNDTSAPIRWLAVAVKANLPAATVASTAASAGTPAKVSYSLRRYTSLSSLSTQNIITVTNNADGTKNLNTGVAQFVLAATNPGIFKTITMNGATVYSDAQGQSGGPYLITTAGQRVRGTPDSNGFSVESGPVRTVVKSSGHFIGTNTPCSAPIAYTMYMTFVRGSADVNLEFNLHNECGRAANADFYDMLYRFNEAGWDFPMNLVNGSTRKSYIVTDTNVYASAANNPGTSEIAQRVGVASGTGVNAWRRARVTQNATTLESPSAVERPLIAVGDQNVTAEITRAWLRFQEPTALSSNNNTLTIKFHSEPDAVGEAQMRWHFAQFSLKAGSATAAEVQSHRDQAVLEVERPLLVHAPIGVINAAAIYPKFPSVQTTALTKYQSTINELHADMVGPGGQIAQMKTYGIIWPETYGRLQSATPVSSPLESPADGHNYWSGTSSELLEYLRTGDPRFVWDWAFPEEQRFQKVSIYNTGSRNVGGNHEGFIIGTSPAYPAGERDRRLNGGSPDYLYNQGSDESYIIYPLRSTKELFTKAGLNDVQIFIESETGRDHWVSSREIRRFQIQLLNVLQYCAEFSDGTAGSSCTTKLRSVMNEMGRDNIASGIACEADSGNEMGCDSGGVVFMYSALTQEFFRRYLSNWGDVQNGAIKKMLGTMAKTLNQYIVAHKADGSIDVDANWNASFDCRFDGRGNVVSCTSAMETNGDRTWHGTKPMHLSTLLVADAIDPSINLCRLAGSAISSMNIAGMGDFHKNFNGVGGWWKGASQSFQNYIFGVGRAEDCAAEALSLPPETANNQTAPSTETPATTVPETSPSPTNQTPVDTTPTNQTNNTNTTPTEQTPSNTSQAITGAAATSGTVTLPSPAKYGWEGGLGVSYAANGISGGKSTFTLNNGDYGNGYVFYRLYYAPTLPAGALNGTPQVTEIGSNTTPGGALFAGPYSWDPGQEMKLESSNSASAYVYFVCGAKNASDFSITNTASRQAAVKCSIPLTQ